MKEGGCRTIAVFLSTVLLSLGILFGISAQCQSVSTSAPIHASSLRNVAEGEHLVRYHGKSMKADEKNACIEREIIHVQKLLDEALALYSTASAEQVNFMFSKAKEFVNRFQQDDTINEHMEEKIILLLGFLYIPADKLVQEMKIRLAQTRLTEDPIAILEEHEKVEVFLTEVHLPLMRLFGEQIRAYISRHGREKFDKFMVDNSLDGVVRQLE